MDYSHGDDEHVALLKQGVDAWNTWRVANADVHPDLIEADLRGQTSARRTFRRRTLAVSVWDMFGNRTTVASRVPADMRNRQMTDVLINYARKDRAVADAIANAFKDEGLIIRLCLSDTRRVGRSSMYRDAVDTIFRTLRLGSC